MAKLRHMLRGAGLGLRAQHIDHVLQHRAAVPWFEVLTDNYLLPGGPVLTHLDGIRALLLDVNNVYVNACNHGFDPCVYLDAMRPQSVKEIHLAGFTTREGYLLDSHGEKVHEPVWDLYRYALKRFGAVPTLIEWDTAVPAFHVLQQEARRAQHYLDAYATEHITA